MQIRNSNLCEASNCIVYSAVNHPWWMSMLSTDGVCCGLAIMMMLIIIIIVRRRRIAVSCVWLASVSCVQLVVSYERLTVKVVRG